MSGLNTAIMWENSQENPADAGCEIYTCDSDETGRSAWEKLAFEMRKMTPSSPKKQRKELTNKTGNKEFEKFVDEVIDEVLTAGFTKLSIEEIQSVARRFCLWIVKMFKFTDKKTVKEYYNAIYQIFYQDDSKKGNHRGLLNVNNVEIMKQYSGEIFTMNSKEKRDELIIFNDEFIYELTLLKTGINIVMALLMMHKNNLFVKKPNMVREYEAFRKLADYINGYCGLDELKIGENFLDALNTCKNAINIGFIMKSTGEHGQTELNRQAFIGMRATISKFISPKGSINISQILGIVCGIRDVKKAKKIVNDIPDVEMKLDEGVTEAEFGKVISAPTTFLEKCPYGKGDGCGCRLPSNENGEQFRKCLNELNHMSDYHHDSKFKELDGKTFRGKSLNIYPKNDIRPLRLIRNQVMLENNFKDWYACAKDFRNKFEDLCETSGEFVYYKSILMDVWKDWLFSNENKNVNLKNNYQPPQEILHNFIAYVESLKPEKEISDDDSDNENINEEFIDSYDLRRKRGLAQGLQV